jgi:hypothetical protein
MDQQQQQDDSKGDSPLPPPSHTDTRHQPSMNTNLRLYPQAINSLQQLQVAVGFSQIPHDHTHVAVSTDLLAVLYRAALFCMQTARAGLTVERERRRGRRRGGGGGGGGGGGEGWVGKRKREEEEEGVATVPTTSTTTHKNTNAAELRNEEMK